MSEAFHFVILEFKVIDGRASESSLSLLLLESECPVSSAEF